MAEMFVRWRCAVVARWKGRRFSFQGFFENSRSTKRRINRFPQQDVLIWSNWDIGWRWDGTLRLRCRCVFIFNWKFRESLWGWRSSVWSSVSAEIRIHSNSPTINKYWGYQGYLRQLFVCSQVWEEVTICSIPPVEKNNDGFFDQCNIYIKLRIWFMQI